MPTIDRVEDLGIDSDDDEDYIPQDGNGAYKSD